MALEPILWYTVVAQEATEGRLMALLTSLPRERWAERGPYGATMLHYACWGDNVAAAVSLLQHGLNVNDCGEGCWSPDRAAAHHQQPRVLEVLCAAGALLVAGPLGDTPLLLALRSRAEECARVLVANGARLRTVDAAHRDLITPELVAFERGVLRCRAATVALLRVKRASRGGLARWDRFLVATLAVHLWASRYAKEWRSS